MRSSILLVLFSVLISASGCASFNAYDRVGASNSRAILSENQFAQNSSRVRIERGKPRPVIDRVGRFFGLPNRIAIGDARVDNHQISHATELEIVNYLEHNGLNSVLVRSNQYAPLDELRRMAQNKKIRPIWKLTFGSYNALKYTFLPGRLTGGDWYNPYTESLHLYSDSPEIAVARATYAQDISTRLNPGAYAAIKDIPIAGLGHDTTATKLALNWYEQNSPERYDSARKILYPNYGASVGGQLASFFPYGEVLGRVVGGGIGRIANSVQTRR